MPRKDFKPSLLADVSRAINEGEATLIFRRSLTHPPDEIWCALTRPKEQIERMPLALLQGSSHC